MNLKKFVLAALFIALSFIGANIKIFGTIAFDSLPAFLGALILGPVYGAVIGFLGHMFTSLLSGFPYGLVIHLVIAASMALTMAVFALAYKLTKDKFSAAVCYTVTGIVGTVLNGPVALAIVYPLLAPIMGGAGVWAMMPILTVAGLANIVIAVVVFNAVRVVVKKALPDAGN